ncbi:transposase [Streptomyces sp. NPDC007251]|uniref:IS1634 family transposase n=1 Tax=Streptomyces sp. NPDC007251 TaxID=3154483 RepID=UPI0033C8C149
MAVTRDGIPVRVWSWPGNTGDQKLIRQVKDDMRDWTLSKIVWVTDRGFSSERNRRYLRQGENAYIVGEKLRSGSPEVKAALSRQGRYGETAQNMRVKEVRIPDTERFVICNNPEAATRDQHIREQLVAQLTLLIEDTDKLSEFKRGALRGKIADRPGLNRYLRTTPAGKLRIDTAKIKAEENLDGKYLLRCSDPHLSAEDIALGYKQLLEVERGWRDMKQIIDLRPVYHRLEERIRAHVILCWLALLLIRITETATGATWPTIRRELDRLHLGTFTGPTGLFRQVTTLTKPRHPPTALRPGRLPPQGRPRRDVRGDPAAHQRLDRRGLAACDARLLGHWLSHAARHRSIRQGPTGCGRISRVRVAGALARIGEAASECAASSPDGLYTSPADVPGSAPVRPGADRSGLPDDSRRFPDTQR